MNDNNNDNIFMFWFLVGVVATTVVIATVSATLLQYLPK